MTLKSFHRAVAERKHVDGLPWGHTTAIFVSNMNFNFVIRVLPRLKIYKPKTQRKKIHEYRRSL
jgi:hypothetical protein